MEQQKNTKSNIVSKSIAGSGGNATYRGKVDIKKSAINSEAMVKKQGKWFLINKKGEITYVPKNQFNKIKI